MRIALISIAALTLAACGTADGDDVSTTADDEVRTRQKVQKVLTVPGPPGEEVEVVVVVGHEPGVDEDRARALLDNIRVFRFDPENARVDIPTDFSDIPPEDLHWADPAEHDVHVEVHGVDDARAEEYRWAWIAHELAEEYCPPGH